jgi:hypothetical protein
MPSHVQIKNVHALLYGELLAEAASTALAEHMPSERLRHAYRRQAADEARHADLFRGYLHRLGAEAVTRPHLPELGAYERVMARAAANGDALTLVLGTNVALEALACVGMAASARWVEAQGGDPAWVSLMAAIEEDERRHTRLAGPALQALGGGEVPAVAREALGEIREAAVATLNALGPDLARWGIDPVVLFEAALRDIHPTLSEALLGG